jgi:hypothetical protein
MLADWEASDELAVEFAKRLRKFIRPRIKVGAIEVMSAKLPCQAQWRLS